MYNKRALDRHFFVLTSVNFVLYNTKLKLFFNLIKDNYGY